MRVRAGCSFEGPGNLWAKESVEDETTNYPEVHHLPIPQQAMYVRIRLEQQLVDFRFFKGNIDQGMTTTLKGALEALAQAYLAPAA